MLFIIQKRRDGMVNRNYYENKTDNWSGEIITTAIKINHPNQRQHDNINSKNNKTDNIHTSKKK